MERGSFNISVFLFGLDGDILNYQWLDFDRIGMDLIGSRASVQKGGRLGVDHQANLAIRVVSAYITGVQLRERSLALVKLHFCLAFHESLACSVFVDPLSGLCAHCAAKID